MIENLTAEQMGNVLRFLLYRMGPETRAALMAEMPVAYSRLYPSVETSILTGRVSVAIEAGRTKLATPTT